MSGKSFNQYLKEYREKKRITKVSLANAIKKTPTYIHRLEKDQCPPPTFELSVKLSKHLKLSEAEHNIFIEAAFRGRLQGDIAYYKHIKKHALKYTEQAKISGTDISFTSLNTENTQNNNTVSYLEDTNTVQLTLNIIPEFEFTSHIKELIKALVTDTLEELNETVFETNFTDTTFELICTNHTHSDCLDTFVDNIKSYTSAVLSHHLNTSKNESYIWQKDHKVSSHTK